MKLTVFQSEKGDCLLVASTGTAADKTRRVLVDGGMRRSYSRFVAPALGDLAAAGGRLDLVCVSHIDQDHIAGVLQLMDDKAAWKVHDFQLENDNPGHPEPDAPRPPEVREVWHNAFREEVGENAGAVGDLLAATAAVLSGAEAGPALSAGDAAALREIAEEHREIAASIPEAIRLSRRLGGDQLGIALNKRFGGKLAFVREDDPPADIKLGPLRVAVVGPFEADLARLRKDWNKWLKANAEALEKIRERARDDAERMGATDVAAVMHLQSAQAQGLGDREKVTAPNLASLMLLVTEAGKTLLLTGDGHADDVLKGLEYHEKLDPQGRIHVDVLKVPHHGSEHNTTEAFAARVTADHYVFCGNGEHENPDLRVVELLIDARLGPAPATHPGAAGTFKFWFNSSETADAKPAANQHMKAVREVVEGRAAASGGRMTAAFLDGEAPSFEFTV